MDSVPTRYGDTAFRSRLQAVWAPARHNRLFAMPDLGEPFTDAERGLMDGPEDDLR
ncbi:hypothetical protein STVIR_0031 [Streptomyces viridochromogenes Tue57]|uniref:Uncharacterized protein n=1 Tax=Streptomyces viridochromogenes Tue57 TaxID=1160705 RepID=L8PUF1_STRVR|nr:hypothetical protein STVIR_0031 [Streptomyces viridochromogenes Tue57]